ncbi:MAG: hypothetical protein H0X38_08810, partial [Planctomycetes bacterium]|nr:hypothetical protein [Planctomycetota bacterium]
MTVIVAVMMTVTVVVSVVVTGTGLMARLCGDAVRLLARPTPIALARQHLEARSDPIVVKVAA